MGFLPTQQELTNALAWFGAPINGALQKGKETMQDIAEWLWVVIQGDFAEEQTTAQVVTGTVISMIPFVDQICDVRDICANCKKISEDDSNPWAWIGLILTLIGLFPTLGSLFKGILKVLLAPVRRFMMRPLSKAGRLTGSGIYKMVEPAIEKGITELNKFLARPAVRRMISKEKVTNIYRWSAKQLRDAKAKVNKGQILGVFDKYIGYLRETVEFVQKYAGKGIGKQAGDMLKTVVRVRNLANKRLGEFLKPVQDFLERLAKRLDAEGGYKATTNVKNVANFRKADNAHEVKSVLNKKPDWVDLRVKPKYRAFDEFPDSLRHLLKKGYPNITDSVPMPLTKAYNTFSTLKATDLKEGTVLYRVLDPKSNDNSICWMRKSEYDKLKSRKDWRKRFAVWAHWNSNGEVATYVVPKGGMKVWEGKTASQVLKDKSKGWSDVVANAKKEKYMLEGGALQIVLDPKQLVRSRVGKRKATPWGYGSDLVGDKTTKMVGVPRLQQNWFEPK